MTEEEVAMTSSLKNDNKPVIVRVKRKRYQSPLEAFWLEINERAVKRPLVDFEKLSIIDSANSKGLEINEPAVKRPLLDFEKLSINDSASKAEELKTKKFFVQHVDTLSSTDAAVDILQSFVASKPYSAAALNSKAKLEDQRHSNKSDYRQKQLLVKAKEKQELLAKDARFKQIWQARKGTNTAASDDALHGMCRLYDVERVDVGETSEVHEQKDDEDLKLVHSFLPLLQEFVPSAAEEIESDIDYQATKDDYVYDLYAVKDDNISMIEENTPSPFPFIQVDDIDDFYDGPDNSDYGTEDSNAEDNPMNDYPEEQEEDDDEEEDGSESSEENSGEDLSDSRSETRRDMDLSEDDMLMSDDEYYDDDDDESYW